MRHSFEKNIHNYRDLAKDKQALTEKLPYSEIELRDLEKALQWHLKKGAEIRKTAVEDQKRIYNLQRKKQEIMDALKYDLSCLDNPEDDIQWSTGSSPITYEDEKCIISKNGEKTPVTLGDMITDLSWDVHYAPDKNVPRNIQKKYLIERAKAELRTLLDQQITIDELASESTSEYVKSAYAGKKASMESGEIPSGLIAETMVQNFFDRIALDHDISFQIIPADIHQDINQKIDFIIHRKSYYRGVDVETTDKDEIGVQFLSTNDQEKINQKEQQLNRAREFMRTGAENAIDDYVLVSIPLTQTKSHYLKWRENKVPGGPDKLWDDTTRETVFRKVLNGILSPDEIDEQWSIINQK